MQLNLLLAAAAVAGVVSATPAVQAATFTLTEGMGYLLPGDFNPAPDAPGLAAGATILRNATLGLSGPGRVTFSYIGSEAGYTNQFWADDVEIFGNKTAGQAPVTLDFGAGALPFAFRTANPAGGAANGASEGFYDSLALFGLSGTSVYALFNDSFTGDKDYDDMVVRMDVAPIPLPAAAWMLLTALGGLGLARRRKAAAA